MELHARLVHAEAGHRVVEVTATEGERSLGSALAEADTAQDAEDLALARLLQRLQITPPGPLALESIKGSSNAAIATTDLSIPLAQANPPSADVSHADAAPPSDRHSRDPQPLRADRPLPAPPPVSAPMNRRQAAPIRLSTEKAAAPERPHVQDEAKGAGGAVSGGEGAEPSVAGSPQLPPASTESQSSSRSVEPPASPPSQQAQPEVSQSDPEEEPPADPEDWSQELAALELNLRRLGWGREEEGAYLQRAFGHPSRSRLTRYSDLRAYLQALEGLERGSDPAVAAVPLRRSELLAQGDGLLARLGWNAEQGRAFLERELQRVSRRQLSDVQLLQFNMLLEGELLIAGGADGVLSPDPAVTNTPDASPAPPVAAAHGIPNAIANAIAMPKADPQEAQR